MTDTTTSAPPHAGCGAFNDLTGLAADAVHRFVVGLDAQPTALDQQAAAAELGDTFAVRGLLRGVFPRTAGEVIALLEGPGESGDTPLAARFFVLGEGSQIPVTPATEGVDRKLRFLVALGAGADGPDVLVSAFHPDEGMVEVMAWDHEHAGFNFYRTVGPTRAWVFAGNSRHALADPTQGNGPFESHLSGSFLMKELRAPWINFHSPDANIQPSVFAQGNPLRTHRWFAQKEPLGGFACETTVARPSINRWAKARFDALASAGTVADPERVLRQVLRSDAVNLVSSHTASGNAKNVDAVDLPQTFFVDSEALTEILGLPAPPPLAVPSAVYLTALERNDVTFTDGEGFSRPGDTHFAFVVPERAFEDQAALREAIRIGLMSERLAAALLMTDFPNPVFSERRQALLQHVPSDATLSGGSSDFPNRFAEALLVAAEATPEGSPEREFASLWEAGKEWRTAHAERLAAYYAAVEQHVATQDGFDAYMRLAESRRAVVRTMPIGRETPLLFARTSVPPAARSMRADGTVQEA